MENYTAPVVLSRRSRQGIVLGLDGWSSLTLFFAIAIGVAATLRFGPIGLVASVPVTLPLAFLALVRLGGMPGPKMAALWLAKQVRHGTGGTKNLFRPERPQLAGTLNMPGVRGNVQVWAINGMAAAYNPADRSVSITAELEVDGFLMMDSRERYELSRKWSTVLASFTQREGFKRITMQERTVPTGIEGAREFFDQATGIHHSDYTSQVVSNYRAVMDGSEHFAVAHRNYLTLTLDLGKLSGQVKSFGGGRDGVLALAQVEATNVTAALRDADLQVRRWLGVRQWAAMSRTAFDPGYLLLSERRMGNASGVDLAAIGPMALEEPRGRNDIVRSDSGVHTTLWIHEWPRSAAPVGFIEPLVFARNPVTGEVVTHILTVVLTPVSITAAMKRIREEKRVWRGNQRMKARRNEHDNAEDRADWVALEAQEESIVQGHGEFRYGAYLTVSARTDEELEASVAGMRNALSRAGMESQILYCQQAEALMVNALPLGLGMN